MSPFALSYSLHSLPSSLVESVAISSSFPPFSIAVVNSWIWRLSAIGPFNLEDSFGFVIHFRFLGGMLLSNW